MWWVDWVFQAANYLNIKGLLDRQLRKKRSFEGRTIGRLSEAKGFLLIVDNMNGGDDRNVDIAAGRSLFPSRGYRLLV